MTPALVALLAGLALVDSTSFGTLLVPVWLLLAPGRLRAGRVVLYLAVAAGFYLVVGLVLMPAADPVVELAGRLAEVTWVAWAQLAVGAAVFALSFWLERRDRGGRVVRRVTRWRERAVDPAAGRGPVVRLALGATLLEVATMLPYVAAIGVIGATDLAVPERVGVLALYCLVMVAPALVLLAIRGALGDRVVPLLARVDAWMTAHAGSATAWVVGAVGFLVARDALGRVS